MSWLTTDEANGIQGVMKDSFGMAAWFPLEG